MIRDRPATKKKRHPKVSFLFSSGDRNRRIASGDPPPQTVWRYIATRRLPKVYHFSLVAGTGFEPVTSGL